MCFRTRLIRLFSIVLLFSVVSSLPAWAQRDRRVKTSVTSSAANHLPVARKALEKGNYNNAIKYAEKVLKANPGNDEALYIKQEAERLLAEEKKFKELQAWDNACSRDTKSAYADFINQYPNSEKRAEARDALSRIAEQNDWLRAKQQATIDAYQAFINKFPNGHYATDAKNAIENIKDQQELAEFNQVKAIDTREAFQQYLRTHTTGKYANQAKGYMDAFDGWEAFRAGDIERAYQCFEQAKKANALPERMQTAYADAKLAHDRALRDEQERQEYLKVVNSPIASVLENYLKQNASSRYCPEISDKLALMKLSGLTAWSTESDFSAVRQLAKSDKVRDQVESTIKHLQGEQKAFNHRQEGGPLVTIGITIPDFVYAKDMSAIGAGLVVKIGRWNDLLNFVLGARYHYMLDNKGLNDRDEGTRLSDYNIGQQIVIPAQVRLNTFRFTKHSKFFVGGGFEYGIRLKSEDMIQSSSMAYVALLGNTSRHFEWSLYYKHYFNGKHPLGEMEQFVEAKHFFGGQVTIYF